MKALVIKAIWFLLIARVIAAPVALRPSEGADGAQGVLVLRRCAWLAQHDRVTTVRITEGSDGGPDAASDPTKPPPITARGLRSALPPHSPLGGDSDRWLPRLRC